MSAGTVPTGLRPEDFPVSRLPAVNVSQVPQRSPLRYPGGKTWLIPHIREWLQQVQPTLLVEPLRLFLVAEAWPPHLLERASRKAGVLFDRCRIVDFSSDISDEVMSRIEQWTAAAACAQGLPS